MISPAKESSVDKLRKYEETISKYEDFTQGRSVGDHLDMVVPGNILTGVKNMVKQMNLAEPLRPPTYGQAPSHGYADDAPLSYNKIFQELLKLNSSTTLMGGDKTQNNMNYFQQNYK